METKQTDFAAQVAENEKAQEHAQEIKQTRVGGLGGSDAAILYKVGQDGLSSLSATDHKRLAVMVGMTEQNDWGGNAYTNAGHMFEEWAENTALMDGTEFEREKMLSQKLALSFKTFAHADFYAEISGTVVECKFVQKDTDQVEKAYYEQLQWYYLMGAKEVYLFHGKGTADPFEVTETYMRPIGRDENAIEILLSGIKTLDKALADGWRPNVVDKVAVEDTPEAVQRAFDVMADVKAQEVELKKKKDEASAILKEYVEGFGISAIVATGEIKHQVIYTKSSTRFSFNAEKFLKEHPEFDVPEYYNKTKVKASVSFK